MKYAKQYKDGSALFEITYEEALNTLLGSYNDNDEMRSMLTITNRIPCAFCEIIVYEGDKIPPKSGLCCLQITKEKEE